MRRTHLREHRNILKRLLIHAGAFNLGLVVRSLLGVGRDHGAVGAARHRTRPGVRYVRGIQ
jgi:transposase